MGVPEKIKKIEEDMLKTQVNKHTERHIGVLRAKLSKLKMEQEELAVVSVAAGLVPLYLRLATIFSGASLSRSFVS